MLWLLLVGLPLLLVGGVLADWWTTVPASEKATYVGGSSCIECHQQQHEQWHGSHHDLAMDLATPETVLGDFNDTQLEHYGVVSKMTRKEGRFFVNTEGADGKPADFEVKYVFGVEPLQQYMVETHRGDDLKEGEIGNVQVLPVTWDTERQEWFYVNPPDVHEPKEKGQRLIEPGDPLHWTGAGANWNRMCADCHSTNLQKNFDTATGHYHTTYSDIDVNCESCHGPGSVHVKLAEASSLFWDRKRGYGLAKLKDAPSTTQVETCARCHVRRHRIVAADYQPGEPFLDYFGPALIAAGDSYHARPYHADGQIRDEVYVTGSYLQSKMYHKGIRCTDCHNPHTTKLKHEGNKLCTSCHTHPAGKYDSPAHHHHKVGSTGASCVECHMPHTTYMEVDPRRDHSIRIPRPDMSVVTGSPNACTGCHLDGNKLSGDARAEIEAGFTREPLKEYARWLESRSEAKDDAVKDEIAKELARLDEWSLEHTRGWYGKKIEERPHWGFAIDAAWKYHAEPNDEKKRDQAEAELIKVARDKTMPAIARASAVQHLQSFESNKTMDTILAALTDKEPLVRYAALGYFDSRFAEVHRGLREANDRVETLTGVIDIAKAEKRQALTIQHLQQQLAQAQQMVDGSKSTLQQFSTAPAKLLTDPVRLVRTEAARVMASVPADVLDGEQRKARNTAVEEYAEGLLVDRDWALAHNSLGVLYDRLATKPEDFDRAIEAYRTAIRIQPNVRGPRSNLAELLERRMGRTRDMGTAQKLHFQIRDLRRDEANLIGREADLLPEDAELKFRHAQALYLADEEEKAIAAFKKAASLGPQREDIRFHLALLYKQRREWPEAIELLRGLLKDNPDNRMYQHVLQETMTEQQQPMPDVPEEPEE